MAVIIISSNSPIISSLLPILSLMLHIHKPTPAPIQNMPWMMTSTLKGTRNPDVLTNIQTGRNG